jgi:hypothetical protein
VELECFYTGKLPPSFQTMSRATCFASTAISRNILADGRQKPQT